jgi:hypothetical protein
MALHPEHIADTKEAPTAAPTMPPPTVGGFANVGPQGSPGVGTTATAVSYPAGRSVNFQTGIGLNDLSLLASGNGWSAASITARAGGTQALATPIRSACTLIAVCATAADSVQLPPAVGGQVMWITNAGAASAQIFANPGADTINGIANGTGIALANGKSVTLMCPLAGAWFSILSA